MKTKITFFMIGVFTLSLMGFTAYDVTKDAWKVPAEYKTKKNPVATSKQSLRYGKELYDMSCASCHGAKGEGNGVKSKNMGIEMYDLSAADYQDKFTDGDIYYQSFVGRYKWHDFRSVIEDVEDRWNVVNYIRSLKK